MEAYKELMKRFEEVTVINNINATIYWDYETKMPKNGGAQRGKELGFIAALMHEKFTDPKIGELIKEIKSDKGYNELGFDEKRNVQLIERDYEKETKVPTELVAEIAEHSTKAIGVWKKAKQEKDYEMFKPDLIKMFELIKKRAEYINPDKDPFDVMLDEYEPGFTNEMYTKLFAELRDGLVPIIQKCVDSPHQPDEKLLRKNIPISIQKKISESLAKLIYYDLDGGRIDETEHPFTTGYYDDVRITTHYYEDNFADSFYSVMHEGGHAIYGQYADKKYIYQPVGNYCSLGIHESQSRFIENLIGRSREFWEYYLPKFQEITGETYKDVDFDSFFHAINQVKPSKIRVTADEATYSLHVIIRFEIERDLFSGKLNFDDLPQAWNKKYKEYLGIDIENDSEGCMQDTHWAGGGFGYFPTYALGNIYNAHQLHAMKKDLPFYDLIREGNLKPIVDWLAEKIHKEGNLYDPPELMKKITGEDLSPKYFIDYLHEKYSKIYKF